MTESERKFVTSFTSVLSNCSLYAVEHETVEELTRKTLSIIEQIVAGSGSLEVMLVENDLIVNKTPFRDSGIHSANLARRLKRKGISRIDFLNGIALSELKQFITEIVEPDGRVGTFPHIRTGTVDVRLSGPAIDIDAASLFRLASLQVEKTRNIYRDISTYGALNTSEVEEIIGTFVEAFRKKADIFGLLSPVPIAGEHVYTHAVNVAVLSMFQAETLGAKDELLYDIGIAALLHDVGKLFIPREIREKEGTLSEEEWEEIRRHTVHGARYLARGEGLTRIAPLVALEHHRRYDGQGYPAYTGKEKGQHLFTQIIAIADFLDSMRNRKHYTNEKGIPGMVSLLQQGAGKEFNPFLVTHFLEIITLSSGKKGGAEAENR